MSFNHTQKPVSTAALIWVVFKRLGFRSMLSRPQLMMAACLLTCVTIVSTLSFFSMGVKATLNHDIAEFLGAPLVIRSEQPLVQNWQTSSDHAMVETVSVTHGAIGPSGYHSVAIKGVSKDYPLQGQIKLRKDTEDRVATADELGGLEAWLDARAMSVLGAGLGDFIQVGTAQFKVTEALTHEPDRLTQLQHTLPRVMIKLDDLSETGIDLYNGRSEYRYLFAGSDEALNRIEKALGDVSSSHEYQVLKPTEGQHPFARMMMRAEKMLGLVLVLVLLLCGSGAAIMADFVVRRYALPSTVLRCMGLSKVVVVYALLTQMAILAIATGLVGGLLGWLIQPGLATLLSPHLVLSSVPLAGSVWVLTCAVALLTLLVFVYPRMVSLTDIPVVSVLRGAVDINSRLWLSASIALINIMLLMWYFSDNVRLTLYLCLGVVILVLLALFLGWGLNKLIGHFHHLLTGSMRVVMRSIGRKPQKNLAPAVAVSLTVMALAVVMTLRSGFLDAYQVQRLQHDGNYMFSALPAEKAGQFKAFIDENKVTLKGMYPMVPAMLVAVNGVDINTAVKQASDTREEIRSPVRLSWAENKPDNNTLVVGDWPQVGDGSVSVEAEVMSDMGLKLGDELTFRLGEKQFSSKIGSQRQFKSGGSMVMFWFMFAPDTLAEFEQYRMGGIELPTESRSLLVELSTQFPETLITDVAQQMQSIRGVMTAVTTLMNSLLVILLLAALPVLIAAVYIGIDFKQHNLLRVFGVSSQRLYFMILAEKVSVGMVSCFVGLSGAYFVSHMIFKEQFGMSFAVDWNTWLWFLLTIPSVFALLGLLIAHKKLTQPVAAIQQS